MCQQNLRTRLKKVMILPDDLVVFDLTDEEIRAFWFTAPSFGGQGHSSKAVKFDRISLSTGLIEQGNIKDEQGLGKILATYASQQACNRVKAYMAIPLQQGFVRAYSLPWLAKRDRKSTLDLLVAEEVPIIRSDLLYDFQVISEERSKQINILLGAVRKSVLERYVFIFEEAGFIIQEINFAFCILGQILGFEPNEDILYLQEESNNIQMVLFRGTVPDSVRTLLPFPSEHLTEGGLQEQPDFKRLDYFETEIRRSLMYYSTQHNDFNLKRLVWNGESIAGPLAQKLLTSNYVLTAGQAEVTGVTDLWRKVLEESKGLSEVSVGYAAMICSQRSGLNLWHQPNKEQRLRKVFWRLAVLSGVIMILGTIACSWLQQKVEFLQQEVELLSRQGAKVLEQAGERRELETLWRKETIHQVNVGDELLKVCALWGSELRIEQITYKQGSMLLSGSTSGSQGVETLVQELRVLGWQQPALTSYQLTSTGSVQFSLSAKRGADTGKLD